MCQGIATVIRHSNHGAIELQIDRQGGSVQINCLMPPRGPGFFLVFPADEEGKALDAAVEVANRDSLPEGANITDTVPGCLAAGTVARPTFQLGTPGVRHDE